MYFEPGGVGERYRDTLHQSLETFKDVNQVVERSDRLSGRSQIARAANLKLHTHER